MNDLLSQLSSSIPGSATWIGQSCEAVRSSFPFLDFSPSAHLSFPSHSSTSLRSSTFRSSFGITIDLSVSSQSSIQRILHDILPIILLFPRSLDPASLTFHTRRCQERRAEILGSERNGWIDDFTSSRHFPILFVCLRRTSSSSPTTYFTTAE